jgi:cell division protein FtsW
VVTITLLCLAFGLVMLYSTSAPYAQKAFGDGHHYLKRQCLWIGLGVAALLVAMRCDVHLLRKASGPLLLVSIALLAVTLRSGVVVNGARRWLAAGPFRFQPSEAAKLALILFLAHRLAWDQRRVKTFVRGFLVPMTATAVVALLVFAEPDFGTSALVAAVAFMMMFVAGTRLIYLLPTVLGGVAAFAVAIMRDPERMGRMLAFLDLEAYGQTAGYQVKQAILAFGSGGTTGVGLGASGQKMFYLPEAHTDFIFPIIGEELGLIATVTLVVAFTILFVAAFWLSLRSGDLYLGLLGMGIALLIGLQAFINMGVVTGILPTKGLPLPFISFGGSNLVVNLAAVGILINIYRHACGELADTLPLAQADRTTVF